MAIFLITGLPGHGKTLYALHLVHREYGRGDRPIYHNAIPGLTLPWQVLERGESWVDTPIGSVIVLDECQRVFPRRVSGAKVPPHVTELETHRHHGKDLYIITQHPRLIDTHVQSLVDTHIHVQRSFGLSRATIHRFPNICMTPERSRANSVRVQFTFPKEVFTWYKSSELHTVKRRIPARIYLFMSFPILIGMIIWYFVNWNEAKMKGGIDSPATKIVQPLVSVGAPSAPSIRPQTGEEYVRSFEPRIPGLAYTAPRYDQVVRVAAAPMPRLCVASSTRCKCYTDQGTALDVPTDLCRKIAENGWFDETVQSAPIKNQVRASESHLPVNDMPSAPG